jgi:nickel-dependent lactate racemase
MYSVPFSKDHLKFGLPPTMKGTLVGSRPSKPLVDLKKEVERALKHPINTQPLVDLAGPGDNICIIFTDITRNSPDHILVPAILKQLETAGVHDADVTLLCGIGMHRPSTEEEKVTKLGKSLVDRYRVLDSEPQKPASLVQLGTTESGMPLSVHKSAYKADLLIATGIVEPHQYAGYSGGRKTLAIGAAGEPMIAFTHGPEMVDHPGTRLGRIEGNPFHEAITLSAKRAGLRFIINVILDDKNRPVSIMAGEPEETFAALVKVARQLYEVPIPQQYDVAVAGVGYPKDENIYQASRAASYLFFAPTPVVREGGVIIIPAPTPEGAGNGVGEQRFYETMKQAKDMSALLSQLRTTGYPPGAQRAFVMAKVLEKNPVIIVGSKTPDVVREVHMIPAGDMEEAFDIAADKIGRKELEVLIVPHGLQTLPIIENGQRKMLSARLFN